MDSIVHSAIEEVCSQGSGGLTLQDLWPKLQTSLTSHGLDICPHVKTAVWSNLLRIPGLQFEAQGVSYNSLQGSSIINSVDKCEQMNLKIIASEQLRNNFVGIYDVEASSCSITKPQRRTLERLAIAGTTGVTQSDLAKEFGIKGNNIFYILKKLETRGLIVRQSTVVKTREVSCEGKSRHSSIVSTNMLHLYRYAKHLGCQQRIEIIKEDKPIADADIADVTDDNGAGYVEESVKEDVHVTDYIPAMKAICDKLEQAEGKVLTVLDIKRDLGYRNVRGHRAWRNILHRLKVAQIVEEFLAKVKNRDVPCLHLLKKFSPKHFEPKSCRLGDDDLDAEPLKRGQITEQLVELPIEHQVYDMIDATGSKGLTVFEALKRLGLRQKQYYDRLVNMFNRHGMHLEAESLKRGVAYRVWTSRNFKPDACEIFPVHSNEIIQCDPCSVHSNEIIQCDPCSVHSGVDQNPSQTILEVDASASKDTVKSADALEVEPEVSSVPITDSEVNNLLLSVKNPQYCAPESNGRVSDMEPVTVNNNIQVTGTSEGVPPARSRRKSYQIFPRLTLGSVTARREQWILKMLEEEKILIKPELHRRLEDLENLEKEKNTTMDRKTLERSLNKLQLKGQCKCINVSVPVMTNLGRNRTTEVILHPSVFTVTPEVLAQIHERMKCSDQQARRLGSRLKKGPSVPVLGSVQRIPCSVKLDSQAQYAEVMRANGYVAAKMIRTKLFHLFLWGFVSSSPDWIDGISSGKQGYDVKNPHSTCRLFELDSAIKAMPLELFLQVASSTKKSEDLIEKCRTNLCLSDLPLEEYNSLRDTRAMGRLSWLVDILQRLKLIRLVSAGHTDDVQKLHHTTLTHALELKPYVEEPVSIISSSSDFFYPDLRPHIRHDFVLSTRKAVNEYWSTLEYCYAAANSKAALHAFPGSAVPEVFLSRSWATVRVISADQRASLHKRIVNDDAHKKLSFKECEGIAKDLNLTLEQVLRFYYDKHRRRMSRFPGAEDEGIQSKRSSYLHTLHKRKRPSESKYSRHAKVGTKIRQLSEEKLAGIPDNGDQSIDRGMSFLTSMEDHVCEEDHIDDLMEAAEGYESNEEDESDSFLHKCALSRLKSRKKKFSWTEAAERQLVIEYARHRAALGAKFHRTDWGSLQSLPAPPDASKRRMAILNGSIKFRKAMMRLCNILTDRYAKHLEKYQNNFSNQAGEKVLVREHPVGEDNANEFEFEEQWDNFENDDVKIALNDVLRCKMTAKHEVNKKSNSDGWANGSDCHNFKMDPSISRSQNSMICGGRSKVTAQRSRSHCFPQNYNKLLNEGTSFSSKVYESVAVSNAVELFKLIFLSTSTCARASTVLAETLRRYSQHDLFAAFSYLRENKMMTGSHGTSPFVLSHQFLENISLSPFPTNTGKRASKFASWLDKRGKDLMEEEIDLPLDLQCGDIFHLCALVSRGELSLTPYLPEEGVGEAEDSRTSKRKSDISDDYDGESSKRMRTSLPTENEIISRREKGFPGIRLSLGCVTLPRIHALEYFKDDKSHATGLPCQKVRDNVLDNTTVSSESNPSKDVIGSGDEIHSALMDNNNAPWETMASYAERLYSSSSDGKRNSPFGPELFKTIYSEIQKSGDQGLSMEEISEVLSIPGDKELEIVVEVLENFGRALKVHAYDSIHVVDSLYRIKYFMTSTKGSEQISKIVSEDFEAKNSYEHLIPNEQNDKLGVAESLNETSMNTDEMHRVTILNHPTEIPEHSTKIQSRDGVEDHSHSESISVRSIPSCEVFELHSTDSHIFRRILPWLNGDGTVNQLVYKGLVRRLLGVVMQHPGIVEDDIIKQMHALNPQSCKKLLEMIVLENHIVVRKMQQTTSTGPPAILSSLFGSPFKKPELICREHFFANPMSTSLL